LRIFIDAAIVKPELGGIATYVSGIVQGLAAQPGIEVCVSTSAPDRLTGLEDVEVVALPESVRRFARRVSWRERELPGLLRAHACEVLLAPTIELPARRLEIPSIMVIHDLGPLQAPGLYGWPRWLRYTAGVPLACRRADHVVCVSNATLLQLRATVGRLATPCSVVGEAGRTLPSVARSASLPPYVLTVGAMLPHKNLETLVSAMDHPDLAGVELHLAGPLDEAERKRLEEWRAHIQQPERVVHHGFVDLQRLADLCAGASVVALPSLFEGFGLPMLEAMRAGAPVVASSIPAFREVGGAAAAYVDEPLDPGAWARALGGVLFDTARAGAMERASRARVEGISWEAIGARLAELARGLRRPR
jgi:glycosyltransferase involved in cell wall biosynthesis